MSERYIGQIQVFGFNFAPRGWAMCEGQLLPISQNSALFSLLGTTFGGDGRTTFGLPDMRGRSPVGVGEPGSRTVEKPKPKRPIHPLMRVLDTNRDGVISDGELDGSVKEKLLSLKKPGANSVTFSDLTTRPEPDLIVERVESQTLPKIKWGQKSGSETVRLTKNNLPPHNHNITVDSDLATERDPTYNYLASAGKATYSSSKGTSTLNPVDAVSSAGSNKPIDIRNPFLGLNVCIALTGTYPSRS
ncbi:MAG: microcystin-dependent protein [Planctomycetaceae bacterium]|jgi:microcystin-dependent protein